MRYDFLTRLFGLSLDKAFVRRKYGGALRAPAVAGNSFLSGDRCACATRAAPGADRARHVLLGRDDARVLHGRESLSRADAPQHPPRAWRRTSGCRAGVGARTRRRTSHDSEASMDDSSHRLWRTAMAAASCASSSREVFLRHLANPALDADADAVPLATHRWRGDAHDRRLYGAAARVSRWNDRLARGTWDGERSRCCRRHTALHEPERDYRGRLRDGATRAHRRKSRLPPRVQPACVSSQATPRSCGAVRVAASTW